MNKIFCSGRQNGKTHQRLLLQQQQKRLTKQSEILGVVIDDPVLQKPLEELPENYVRNHVIWGVPLFHKIIPFKVKVICKDWLHFGMEFVRYELR